PGWLAGADTLFAHLLTTLAWRSHRRPMYGSLVEEPRLGATVEAGPGTAIVDAIVAALAERYGRRLDAVWANYYRDGRDSVAWHADRVGRHRVDPLVAIVSLGGPRRFALRPRGGPGPTHRLVLASGDLLVMGGACQHAWEHTVPKMAHAHPRISLTFRERGPGVRGTGSPRPATRA
ncbi:MAG: alpha-ketoglutarate-dependent dioxygenase AlkB, partial [Actinomyces sp.]